MTLTTARRVAVLQPLPGIGDMLWHLPHIRALADHVGAPVTLIAKPRSAADQLFRAEHAVRDVLWLDRNPERRRGRHDGPLGLRRLVAELKLQRFDAIYLLHHSRTLALVATDCRHSSPLRLRLPPAAPSLSRPPFLPASILRLHPHEQATRWLAVAEIPLEDPEPRLAVDARQRERGRPVGLGPGPVVAIGIGSSEPYKQWGAERFAVSGGRTDRVRLGVCSCWSAAMPKRASPPTSSPAWASIRDACGWQSTGTLASWPRCSPVRFSMSATIPA